MVETTQNQQVEKTDTAPASDAPASTTSTEAQLPAIENLTVNPEEEKKEFIYHGMANVANKNKVQNLESRKATWQTMEVPSNIEAGLAKLHYFKPSIIQAHSIPLVMKSPQTHFAFQAMNGSGKTGAFVVPALMKVDPSVLKIQVIIMAYSRELIRQITQVTEVLSSETQVKTVLGEKGLQEQGHIMVTVPGYLKNRLSARQCNLDLSALKMIVYDEADELFVQTSNHECFLLLKKHLTKLNVSPQHCLYSATYTDQVVEFTRRFVGEFEYFPIKKEAQKLKGVRNYKMKMSSAEKLDFAVGLHTRLERAMTMVFVNRKDTAQKLQTRLKQRNIESKILIGGLDNAERDTIIDGFRQGYFTTLISTNVLARGIDVPEVDLVINYDVPMVNKCGFYDPDFENFLHRVGRTGRFGTDGLALTLMSEELDPEMVRLIAEHYDIEINELPSFDELSAIYTEMRGSNADAI